MFISNETQRKMMWVFKTIEKNFLIEVQYKNKVSVTISVIRYGHYTPTTEVLITVPPVISYYPSISLRC